MASSESEDQLLRWKLSSGIRRRNIFGFPWEFRHWSNPRASLWCDPL